MGLSALAPNVVHDVWPWAALLLLGAAHGVNPGMGWLFAVALGGLPQLTRMCPAAVGVAEPGQHAGQLGHPVFVLQTQHAAGLRTALHHQMRVGVGGHLRQVGDDDDLMGAGQPRQAATDLHRGE